MDIDMALPAAGEAAAPAADGADGELPLEAWNAEVGQARFPKMFLGGHGAPVASVDGPVAKVATNGLLVDVVLAVRRLGVAATGLWVVPAVAPIGATVGVYLCWGGAVPSGAAPGIRRSRRPLPPPSSPPPPLPLPPPPTHRPLQTRAAPLPPRPRRRAAAASNAAALPRRTAAVLPPHPPHRRTRRCRRVSAWVASPRPLQRLQSAAVEGVGGRVTVGRRRWCRGRGGRRGCLSTRLGTAGAWGLRGGAYDGREGGAACPTVACQASRGAVNRLFTAM